MHSTVFNRQFSAGSTGEYAKSRHKFISSCGNFIYHLGIIDYLQEFNMDKIAENKFKTFSNWKTGHLISAINAIDYQKRFVDFMREEVIIEQSSLRKKSGRKSKLSDVDEEERDGGPYDQDTTINESTLYQQ